MTDLLDRAIEVAGALPRNERDAIAHVVLQLAGSDDDVRPAILSRDERAAIAVSKAAAERGDFATDDEVRTVWTRHAS
jgi:hypothetical protein